MKKNCIILFALILSLLGVSDAKAQKIYRAELDASMFKAWTSNEPSASVNENPDPDPKLGYSFSCDYNLYRVVSAYQTIFGNVTVYYLWYADVTGTNTITFKGTPGMDIRMLINREPYVEGITDDADGGDYVELVQKIGNDGKTVFDVSSYEYVHINAIKVASGSIDGVVKSIMLEGTVKPVTGLLSMINNGDAEGDDLSSFPVSYDSPNNYGTVNEHPEVVEGGVNGKCFKVTAFDNPSETWHTQFYIKADEVMPKGTKWQLKMAIKADKATSITTSAQGLPQQWKGAFVDEFNVGTEWNNFSWEGTIGVNDFQSVAFDLSNENGNPGNAGVSFYFDNIEFGVDLGGSNPLANVQVRAGYDVIQVDLADMTNMKSLVTAAPTKTLIYDNSCATVTINGEPCEILSVEGFSDGNLYIFLAESAPVVDSENNVVKISFNNPTDAEHQLLLSSGKFEGQPLPGFSGLEATYEESLGEGEPYVSYLWGAPMLVEASPEAGSFNLSAGLSEFILTFNQNVNVASVVAKLDTETLTATGNGEYAKAIKLTRTSNEALSGIKELIISQAWGEKGQNYGLEDPIIVKYSFGPVPTDEEPEVLFTDNFGANNQNNYVPEGWIVNSDAEEREAGDYGSGCRVIVNGGGDNGFISAILYVCSRSVSSEVEVPGQATYGATDNTKLYLTARPYVLSADAARWDAEGTERKLKMAICTEAGVELDAITLPVAPSYKQSKGATHLELKFEAPVAGNYVIKFVPMGMNGSPAGYGDACAIGNIKLEYIPNVLGIVETKKLNEALAAAKKTYGDILEADAERYLGEAMTALDDLIKEVETNKVNYSAPSLYVTKAEELQIAAKAANDHKAACDAYDKAIKLGIELVEQFKDSKFAPTSYYSDLTTVVNKYHGQMEMVNLGGDEDPIWETNYSFDILSDDAALATAKTELSVANTMASKMFTEGKPTKGTTGYAALHERLRRGVELLKSLGLDDTASEIAAADAELGDNDQIAGDIVTRASKIILAGMADGAESQLFVIDPKTETTPSYDLSVFFKNPNMYGSAYSTEVPGWTSVVGNCIAFSSWTSSENHSASTPYPEDCDIHGGWHPNPYAMVEQTVENLPAGIYTIKVKCSDNGNSWEDSGTCAYVRTSKSPQIEAGADIDRESDFYAYTTGTYIEGVPVVDGKLTIGFYYGNTSQAFFEDVEVWLTAPAPNYDYKEAYVTILGDDDATIAMGSNGIATYSNVRGLDFTGVNEVKAYIASGYRPSTGELTLTRVYRVPAGEGLLLKGDAGSYDIPSVTVDDIYANLLVGVPTATTISPTEDSYTNFILANDAVNGIGFYPLSTTGRIAAGKAYLQLPSLAFAASRRVQLVFEDDEEVITGISTMKAEMESKPVFDLQGRRIVKPTRGLYIKDGKKMMVK